MTEFWKHSGNVLECQLQSMIYWKVGGVNIFLMIKSLSVEIYYFPQR